ncbi:MAG: hypothetical protein IJQ82_07010 [Selenomonadaceae bacterium]|nr:hypothetical protein [Selenomonadaceae bacterium]
MNGSENGYAGALFFALMSLGALIKLDDVVGLIVGAVCAILAAMSLRLAVIKSAQAVEEDHQRIEIQFQQLRSKFNEASAVNAEAMNSVNDAAQLVQENLQVIRVRLAELDNLTQIAEDSQRLRSTLENFGKDSSAIKSELEKKFEQLNEIETSNKASLQTILKLIQLVAQLIKNQTYSKDLEKINSSLVRLADKIK